MKRFSAKLLFQYRVEIEGDSGRFRTVEERIVTTHSPDARSALETFKHAAHEDESSYLNDEGNRVYIEFVGIVDMMELGLVCGESDVWYDIRTMLTPMERKAQLIPDESVMLARIGRP